MNNKDTLQKINELTKQFNKSNFHLIGRGVGLGKMSLSAQKPLKNHEDSNYKKTKHQEVKNQKNHRQTTQAVDLGEKKYLPIHPVGDSLEQEDELNSSIKLARQTEAPVKYVLSLKRQVLVHFVDMIVVLFTCIFTFVVIETAFFGGVAKIKNIGQLFTVLDNNNISFWYILLFIYILYLVYFITFKIFTKKTVAVALLEIFYKSKKQ